MSQDVQYAEQNLMTAINASRAQDIMEALTIYADVVGKVQLQILARNLLISLGSSTNDIIDSETLEKLRKLVTNSTSERMLETSAAREQESATSRFADPIHLIGIGGQANMGKDEACALLRRRFPALERRAFGDGVKAVVSSIFDVDYAFIEQWKRDPNVPPGLHVPMRKALQIMGDGLRTIKSSVWIDMLFKTLPAAGVYCDVRYFNEADAIRERGGVMILIGRSENLSDESNLSEATLYSTIKWFLEHTSDNVVDVGALENPPIGSAHFDFFLRNDGTMEELATSVETLADRLL